MTRDEIYTECVQKIEKTNCLLLESATGTGKTLASLKLTNYILSSKRYQESTEINILILVAKRVHKQTWEAELKKWGGIKHPTADLNICMECYESLKNHCGEHWNTILMDEVHHLGSDLRKDLFRTLSFDYAIGLSATIPLKLKQYFQYKYHAQIVSCNLTEAIEDNILPEPQILLFPLLLDNRIAAETWEINARQKGPVVHGEIKDIWKYKKKKVHALLSCTQKQKVIEFDKLIEWEKKQYLSTRREPLKMSWLYHAGKRLEYLANCKNQIVYDILKKLEKERTITFCKTILQSEVLGKYCIHSQNGKANDYYSMFNQKKINHITAVNILNENANLVDCKYAIFANIVASETQQAQRIGKL